LHDEGDFSDSIASLLRMDLIRAAPDPRGEILFFESSKRRALDIYRNSILHFLAAPSFLALELLRGGSREEVLARLYDWLDAFRGEFFSPRGPELSAHVAAFLSHFEALGWTQRGTGALRATEAGEPHLAFFADQMRAVLESYYVAVSAVAQQGEPLAAPRASRSGCAISSSARRARRGRAARGEQSGHVRKRARSADPARRARASSRPGVERREPLLGRGPAWAELASLRERLATALRAR
jgi:hypothetical protein